MQHQNILSLLIAVFISTTHTLAQSVNPPALTSIRTEDIKADIFAMAGDHFRGREAGTLDELKAAAWLADNRVGGKPIK
jgi:hypothetical protein